MSNIQELLGGLSTEVGEDNRDEELAKARQIVSNEWRFLDNKSDVIQSQDGKVEILSMGVRVGGQIRTGVVIRLVGGDILHALRVNGEPAEAVTDNGNGSSPSASRRKNTTSKEVRRTRADLERELDSCLAEEVTPDSIKQLVVYWHKYSKGRMTETSLGRIYWSDGEGDIIRGIVVEDVDGERFVVCNHKGSSISNHDLVQSGHNIEYWAYDASFKSRDLTFIGSNRAKLTSSHISQLRNRKDLVLSEPAAMFAQACVSFGNVPNEKSLERVLIGGWNETRTLAHIQQEILSALNPAYPEKPSGMKEDTGEAEETMQLEDEWARLVIEELWNSRGNNGKVLSWTFEEIADTIDEVDASSASEFHSKYFESGLADQYLASRADDLGGVFVLQYDSDEGEYSVVPEGDNSSGSL